jgi:poly-gamma-glutamate system protein
MYRPNLKSGRSLIALFVLSLILFAIAQSSYKVIRSDYYDEKVKAANLMEQYLQVIHDDLKAKGFEFDPIDDPFNTGLIGNRLSPITTSRGSLSEKQTALNPNLAAAFVQRFKDSQSQTRGLCSCRPHRLQPRR